MPDRVIENPIINSPYREPGRHFVPDEVGITNEVAETRRCSAYFVPVPQARKQSIRQLELVTEWALDRIRENREINEIRAKIQLWRRRGYPDVTPTTRALLEYWNDPERDNSVLFFQRKAAEAAIYIAESAPKSGDLWIRNQLDADNAEHNNGLPRLALKMATGSCKTVIMMNTESGTMAVMAHDRSLRVISANLRHDSFFIERGLVLCSSYTIALTGLGVYSPQGTLLLAGPSRGEPMTTLSGSYSDIAEDFDSLFDDVDQLTELEASSLDAVLRPLGARTVLDCAVGTGIQAIGLARLGYQVAGSDASPEMLSIVTKKALAEGLAIETRKDDFRTLGSWRGRIFDAVICCGGSLTLVPHPSDMKRALRSMARVLKRPSGLAIIGLHNYGMLRRKGEAFILRRLIETEIGIKMVFDVRLFGSERARVIHSFMTYSDGQWNTRCSPKEHHYLSPAQLAGMMRQIGFTDIRLLDIKGLAPAGDDEWVLATGVLAA